MASSLLTTPGFRLSLGVDSDVIAQRHRSVFRGSRGLRRCKLPGRAPVLTPTAWNKCVTEVTHWLRPCCWQYCAGGIMVPNSLHYNSQDQEWLEYVKSNGLAEVRLVWFMELVSWHADVLVNVADLPVRVNGDSLIFEGYVTPGAYGLATAKVANAIWRKQDTLVAILGEFQNRFFG